MPRVLAVAVPALAVAILAFTLIPASVWKAPSDDVAYSGFDPNLVYTNGGGGGGVRVSTSSVFMQAPAGSSPTANLLTTPLKKIQVSFDVSITSNESATEPFRIGFWSPWSDSGEFIVFGPAPQNTLGSELLTDAAAGRTLTGGVIAKYQQLGRYRLATPYHVAIDIDKAAGVMTSKITGPDGTQGEASLAPHDSPSIFGPVQISVTGSALPGSGSSVVRLTKYKLVLPHQRLWASKIDDSRATFLLVVLTLLALASVATGLIGYFLKSGSRSIRLAPNGRGWPARNWLLIALALSIYLIGNVLLFPLGAHPFDMSDEQLYAYVSRTYGTWHLFYLPNVVSLAAVWGGVPYGEFAFPYEPVTAYLSAGIGWLSSLLFAGGGTFALDSSNLIFMIKGVNVLFGLGDAALIYLVLRRIGVAQRWSLIPAAIFLFNPAVWFNMSVWGQTHVISLFLVLAAIYLAERHLPFWAWLALAAACLTRPQMLVFGLLLGIVFLRKFSWRENVTALSWTAVVTFVAIVPLTTATSPSLPIDIMLHNFNVQEGGGNTPKLNTVSQGAYSLWPFITYLAHGASGTLRAFTPSDESLVGRVSYQLAAQFLTGASLLLIAGVLAMRRTVTQAPGGYIPLVALGIVSFLMLLTGIVSTHFLLALPFLLMCRRWMNNAAFFFVAVAWTISTLIPMWGDMSVALTNHSDQILAPARNVLSNGVMHLYAWDRFITVGIVANMCAAAMLAVAAFRAPAALRTVQP